MTSVPQRKLGYPELQFLTVPRSKHYVTCSDKSQSGFYLEVVCCVAVSVLGYMQKDEEVLSEVVSHSRQPGKTVVGEAEVHHLSGRRS